MLVNGFLFFNGGTSEFFLLPNKILFQQMKNNAVAYIVLGVVKARDSNVFYLISEFHVTLKCTGNE